MAGSNLFFDKAECPHIGCFLGMGMLHLPWVVWIMQVDDNVTVCPRCCKLFRGMIEFLGCQYTSCKCHIFCTFFRLSSVFVVQCDPETMCHVLCIVHQSTSDDSVNSQVLVHEGAPSMHRIRIDWSPQVGGHEAISCASGINSSWNPTCYSSNGNILVD